MSIIHQIIKHNVQLKITQNNINNPISIILFKLHFAFSYLTQEPANINEAKKKKKKREPK